ncbi:MAG: DUF262 domain-containing protein, partial [Mycoplasmataceae bacterium]|nr:DUF262 domain-containing protein [Mycoplasmataceae bacterium]
MSEKLNNFKSQKCLINFFNKIEINKNYKLKPSDIWANIEYSLQTNNVPSLLLNLRKFMELSFSNIPNTKIFEETISNLAHPFESNAREKSFYFKNTSVNNKSIVLGNLTQYIMYRYGSKMYGSYVKILNELNYLLHVSEESSNKRFLDKAEEKISLIERVIKLISEILDIKESTDLAMITKYIRKICWYDIESVESPYYYSIPTNIKFLMSHIHDFKIPSFQREMVIDTDFIKSIVNSVRKNKKISFGSIVVSFSNNRLYVIDGQQRISSMSIIYSAYHLYQNTNAENQNLYKADWIKDNELVEIIKDTFNENLEKIVELLDEIAIHLMFVPEPKSNDYYISLNEKKIPISAKDKVKAHYYKQLSFDYDKDEFDNKLIDINKKTYKDNLYMNPLMYKGIPINSKDDLNVEDEEYDLNLKKALIRTLEEIDNKLSIDNDEIFEIINDNLLSLRFSFLSDNDLIKEIRKNAFFIYSLHSHGRSKIKYKDYNEKIDKKYRKFFEKEYYKSDFFTLSEIQVANKLMDLKNLPYLNFYLLFFALNDSSKKLIKLKQDVIFIPPEIMEENFLGFSLSRTNYNFKEFLLKSKNISSKKIYISSKKIGINEDEYKIIFK